ncbi:hypothetical protein [Nocardia asteroides]|uniref:hypothetical protein n=1 Tax=Nocardia asteroides TaxID=1824 RepID=UPI003407BE15
MTADRPPIADQDAHDQRVHLDAQIRALTDKIRDEAPRAALQDRQRDLVELRNLQAARRRAFRREVGWADPDSQ